jgi:tetratricopeptide (TPR) repeat protein
MSVQKAPTPVDKAWGQRSLGWACCRAGELKKGMELLTTVLPIFRAGQFINSEIPLMCFLGEGHWLSGEGEQATHSLEIGLEMAKRCGVRYYTGFAHRLLGEITITNNPTKAAHHFEKSIAIFREIKAENELALSYVCYGRIYKQQNKIAKAREYLMKALEIFERLCTLIEPDRVKEELTGLPET